MLCRTRSQRRGETVERNVGDAIRRHLKARKRAVGEERTLDELRSSGAAGLDGVVAAGLSPRAHSIHREKLGQIQRHLKRLPSRQREAVQLRYIERRTIKYIAAHFQCTPAAAAQLIHRGLSKLRQMHDEIQSPT
jgi:RNA polymerase sigma factor (sigma-70 family)